ncbi:MAG: hypothetical protein KAS75_05840 [Planctomycetes bacterium]|nr:hypothetical protein [Planctomycetota bacterium]
MFKKFILLISLCSLMSGCGHIPVGKKYIKGDLSFNGRYREILSKETSFDEFMLGSYRSFDKQYVRGRSVKIPEVYLETQDGTLFYLPKITVEYVKSNWKKQPCADKECLKYKNFDVLYGATAEICQDHLVFFHYPWNLKAMWDKDKTHRHSFPLNYDDLIALFGEPDDVYELYGE